MSALAAYFDISGVYSLSESDLTFSHFPYVYSKEIFSNYCEGARFNNALLADITGSKLSNFDLLVSGFVEPPVLDQKPALSVDTFKALKALENYYPVFVNSYSVITNDNVVSSLDVGSVARRAHDTHTEESDYYANLSLYPQLVPNDISTQIDLDNNTVVKAKYLLRSFNPATKTPIVFTGGRFSQKSPSTEITYALMLDLIENPGIYNTYIDKRNAYILLSLLKLYQGSKFTLNPLDLIEKVGAVVRTNGAAEVLLNSDYSTKQLVDVPKNSIFVIPLDKKSQAKLTIKNASLGTLEANVSGGTLGIVIDTREVGISILSEMSLVNLCVKQFGEVLRS